MIGELAMLVLKTTSLAVAHFATFLSPSLSGSLSLPLGLSLALSLPLSFLFFYSSLRAFLTLAPSLPPPLFPQSMFIFAFPLSFRFAAQLGLSNDGKGRKTGKKNDTGNGDGKQREGSSPGNRKSRGRRHSKGKGEKSRKPVQHGRRVTSSVVEPKSRF